MKTAGEEGKGNIERSFYPVITDSSGQQQQQTSVLPTSSPAAPAALRTPRNAGASSASRYTALEEINAHFCG